jgi:hypothetical protein
MAQQGILECYILRHPKLSIFLEWYNQDDGIGRTRGNTEKMRSTKRILFGRRQEKGRIILEKW